MSFDHNSFIASLPRQPGVYRMLDASGAVIYVGKACDLKKRVRSYFNPAGSHSPKTAVMRTKIASIEITVTHNENEALILESNLIKAHQPRYNVWFRDDKSYPYIRISMQHPFSQFSYYRGARNKSDKYMGPFPGASAATKTLHLLQKLFQIRTCEDSVFAHRTRPCLQYQIGRCSAPCVGYINKKEYRCSVEHAILFLEGRNEEVLQALTKPMQEAAAALNFESAARYRDQISNLRKVQEKQYINCTLGEVDIIACVIEQGQACVEWVSVRGGLHLGSRSFYPRHDAFDTPSVVLSAFLCQTWFRRQGTQQRLPREILCNGPIEDRAMLEAALSGRAGHKVAIRHRLRGHRAKWLAMTQKNAELSLRQHLLRQHNQQARFDDLRVQLSLDEPLQRIECFDISHTQGEATVASCVVFGPEGAISQEYRRFNIRTAAAGDDYCAIGEAVKRRYAARRGEPARQCPDLLLIDGGKGQARVAREALIDLGLTEIPVLGVAKGAARKSGEETFILAGRSRALPLSRQSPAVHLIQQIRDEAHRFAIQAHRRQRGRTRTHSVLQEIGGVGPQRRQALLQHFGGLQGVVRAGAEDLERVAGISHGLAQKIHAYFHGDR